MNVFQLQLLASCSPTRPPPPPPRNHPQTVMNPTLSLIERMKVVGMDVERRKSAVPDRFFSHFYFGPDKTLASVSCCLIRLQPPPCVTACPGETVRAGAEYAQRSSKTNADSGKTAASGSVARQTQTRSEGRHAAVESARSQSRVRSDARAGAAKFCCHG